MAAVIFIAPVDFFLEEVFFLAPAVFLTPVFLVEDFFAAFLVVFLAAGAFFAVPVFFAALFVVRFFALERDLGLLPGVTALAAVLTASANSPWKSCAAAAAIPLEVFFVLAMCNPHKSYKQGLYTSICAISQATFANRAC